MGPDALIKNSRLLRDNPIAMHFSEPFLNLSSVEFWTLLTLACAGALAALYFAFHYIALARLIEDTPTSKIEFAQQGYVELSGNVSALPGEVPLLAPLSTMECCWFHYKIEKRAGKSWRMVEQQRSSRPFLIEDESGICLVDPQGARVTTREYNVWYGNARHPGLLQPIGNSTAIGHWNTILHRDTGIGNDYRYSEERISLQCTIYAIGNFSTLDDLDHRSNREESTRGLLRRWKQEQPRLLARFDRDRNGLIDQEEWQQARLAAASEADAVYARERIGKPSHRLADSSSSGRPYLISTLPQFSLIRRFKLISLATFTALFICGGITIWMLSVHFGT